MARPTKQGLDYFALDVTMNDEVEIIEAEHGLVGYAILIKLFQKIYSEGYYHNWNDRDIILFSNRVNVDRNLLTSIVDDCIKWGIFDKQLFDKYNILTSKRIQKHYFIATYKRVDIEVIKNYLLIDVSDRTNLLIVGVSVDSNGGTSIVPDGKSTQSKVKEKILKDIIKTYSATEIAPTYIEDVKRAEIEAHKQYKKMLSLETEKLALENFNILWGLYPNKKGRARVSDTQKKVIYKLGDEFIRCIDRYKKDIQKERLSGFKDKQYQNGSTFFNSGYVDYLDSNYNNEVVETKYNLGSERFI